MSSFNSYLYSLGIAEQFLPDEYTLKNNQLTVPNAFVLSRTKNGETLSVYSDNVWDLSPYLPKCDCRLNFDSWLENARENDFLYCQIRAEMKKISFALLYIKSGNRLLKVLNSGIRFYASLQQLHIRMAVHCSSYLAMLLICQK